MSLAIQITEPRELTPESYGFNAIINGVLLPGFRIYMGKIQAPMKKVKSMWAPQLWMNHETAVFLYDLVKQNVKASLLSEMEKSIAGLVYDGAIEKRFGL